MRVVLVWVVGLALVWPQGTVAASQHIPQPEALRAKAQQILDHAAELAELWPGYWPQTQGFVLYHPTHGAVFVGGDGQPGTVRYQAGVLPGARTPFVFDYPGGAPNMILMTVDDDWRQSAEILFHEQFHDFQRDAFGSADLRHGGEYVDLTVIPDRAAFTTAAELERRVLADALMVETDAAREELSRRYIALRREREATVGDPIVLKERYRERSEGTAQFIGLSATSRVFGDDGGSTRDALVGGLKRDLIAAPGTYSSNWFRLRAYHVGGAIAWLLDRSGGDWKTRVQAGEALDVVLEDQLGATDPAERVTLAQAARAAHGADALLVEITQALAAMPRALETPDDFLALGDRTLVVEIQAPRDRINEGREFSQAKGRTALGPSTMAYPDLQAFQVEKPGVLMRIENLPVMTAIPRSPQDQPLRQIYTILLDEGINLATLNALGPGEHTLDTLDIQEGGLTLDIDVPATVTVTGREITVRTAIAGSTLTTTEP